MQGLFPEGDPSSLHSVELKGKWRAQISKGLVQGRPGESEAWGLCSDHPTSGRPAPGPGRNPPLTDRECRTKAPRTRPQTGHVIPDRLPSLDISLAYPVRKPLEISTHLFPWRRQKLMEWEETGVCLWTQWASRLSFPNACTVLI